MKLTIYTADCTGDAANCRYPHKVDATSAAELAEAVAHDHVSARYLNDYRSNDNFMEATVIEMDCDTSTTLSGFRNGSINCTFPSPVWTSRRISAGGTTVSIP